MEVVTMVTHREHHYS